MPLHTYTVNFATSSNLQEILYTYLKQSISSPLPTYNMRNHHVSTLQAPLLPTVRLRYTSSNSNSGTTFFSTISCLFILIHLISLPHQTCKKSYQTFHLLTYSYL